MSRASNGTYTAPTNSWNPAVEGTAIDETDWNAILDDIETALTDSLSVSGKGKVTAHIDFDENGSPGTPATNVGRFYAADVGGLTTPFWKDASGNTYNLLLSSPGLSFTFDTSTTTGSDPGAGKVRFNNATVSSVTEIAVDDADAVGNDVATFLNNISANTYLIFTKRTGAGVAIFQVTSVTNDSGFTKYGVTYSDHDGTFASADPLSLSVGPAGPAGAAGAAGLNWRGAWLTATAYAVNDGASNGGSSYICTQAHTSGAGTEPGVGASWATYWSTLAAKGADGAGTGDVSAASNFGTDNRLIRSDGTTKGVQASAVTIDDSGNMSGVGTLITSGVATVGTTAATAVKFDPSGFVELPEVSAPSTPASGFLRLYAKSDGKAYQKNDAGTETDLSQSGGGSGSPSIPQGRLTLSTGVPVMTSTTSAQTTVYYTPYTGRYVPLYDGTSWTMTDVGGELSQTTTDTTKSPAAVTTNSNYDLFVWNDSGTYRCTRGPAWSSDTSRGSGAGTTEIERVNGIWVNKVAITNGPGAQRGTYVGTIRTNGTSSVDYILGGSAAGGTAAMIGVWNAYNRVFVSGMIRDTTDTWTYSSTTVRAANGSSTMRVSMVRGLNDDAVSTNYFASGTGGSSTNGVTGASLDSTSTVNGFMCYSALSASLNGSSSAGWAGLPGLGFHYISAIEACVNSVTAVTWYGDAGISAFQTGLAYQLTA